VTSAHITHENVKSQRFKPTKDQHIQIQRAVCHDRGGYSSFFFLFERVRPFLAVIKESNANAVGWFVHSLSRGLRLRILLVSAITCAVGPGAVPAPTAQCYRLPAVLASGLPTRSRIHGPGTFLVAAVGREWAERRRYTLFVRTMPAESIRAPAEPGVTGTSFRRRAAD